jgi:hypothetical protein
MARAVIIAMLALAWLAAPVRAEPMKCSSEQRTCAAACQRVAVGLIPICVEDCRTRFNACRATGCWDNGMSRYCGLLRQ